MILHQLHADADAIYQDVNEKNLPPPMFDFEVVNWIIPLTIGGELDGDPIRVDSRRLIPHNYGRSVDIVSNLLVDTADYALGLLDKKGNEKNAAFLVLARKCADATDNIKVKAIIRFLESGGLPSDKVADMEPKQRVTFCVDDEFPYDDADVRTFWEDLTSGECKGKPKQRGICLITGLPGFVESILSSEIRISRESAPLISVNEDSANSYGFEQAINGAVSRNSAERFTKALNALMHGEHSHVTFRLAPKSKDQKELVYVFWTPKGTDSDVHQALNSPQPDLVKRLLKSVETGKHINLASDAENQFFALALSGNKSRVVFRDWLQTSLPSVKSRLEKWLRSQEIIDPFDSTIRYYSVSRLMSALYRVDEKRISRHFCSLLRSALHEDNISAELLTRVVHRCRIEKRVSHLRAVFIKLTLTLNRKENYNFMAGLDPDCIDPPYICGRMFAVLEDIQYQAQGNLNNNLTDRFFSAAAVTPRRIFPILIRNTKKAHLPKIRRLNKGFAFHAEEPLMHLLNALSPVAESPNAYPTLMTTEQQAVFLLGYYHQRCQYIIEREERKAKRTTQSGNDKPRISEEKEPNL